LLASHSTLAADLPLEIHLALCEAKVYGRSITVLLLASWAKLASRSAFSFLGMLECPGTQRISVAMPCAKTLHILLLIRLASGCPRPSSRCAAGRIAACESLKTTTVITPCIGNVSLVSIATSGTSPIAHSLAMNPPVRTDRVWGRAQSSPVQPEGWTGLDHRLPVLDWTGLVWTSPHTLTISTLFHSQLSLKT